MGSREEEGVLGEVYRGIGTSNGASSFFRRMFGDMVSGLFLRVGWDLGVLGKLGWAQDLVVDTSLTIMGLKEDRDDGKLLTAGMIQKAVSSGC